MKTVNARIPKKNKTWELFAQYPYIYAWGMHMGSYEYYIVQQIRNAIKDNAPRTALFQHMNATQDWCTIDGCKNEGLKFLLIRTVNAQFPDNNITLP